LLHDRNDLLNDNFLREIKDCVLTIIGTGRTPAVHGDWDEWLELVFRRELDDRELIALYIKLLEGRILPKDFADDLNVVLEREKHILFYNKDADRWWLVDEGVEFAAYTVQEAVSLVRAKGLDEVDNALREAAVGREKGQWEYCVWKCSKAVEAVGRHCLRNAIQRQHGPVPDPMPTMDPCAKQLTRQRFWSDDEPLAKLFDIIKGDFRNPTSHLDDDPNSSRPANQRDCNNEGDASLAFVLSHLTIYWMIRRS